jgi:hypothetical protein
MGVGLREASDLGELLARFPGRGNSRLAIGQFM